jgi:hypothetical protein
MVRIMPDQTTRGAACAANLCYRISHGQTAVKVSRGNTGMGLAGVRAQKGNPRLAATKSGAPITVQPAALWPSPNPSALQASLSGASGVGPSALVGLIFTWVRCKTLAARQRQDLSRHLPLPRPLTS